MRQLIALIIVVALAGLGTTAWFYQSPHYVLLELMQAVSTGDVDTVEKYVDTQSVAKNAVDLPRAMAEVAAEATAGALGRGLAKFVGNIAEKPIYETMIPRARREIRASIADGSMWQTLFSEAKPASGQRPAEILGPVRLPPGYDAFEQVTSHGDLAVVTLNAFCNGSAVQIDVDMTRAQGDLPFLDTWRIVGMDEASLYRLARACTGNSGQRGSEVTPR